MGRKRSGYSRIVGSAVTLLLALGLFGGAALALPRSSLAASVTRTYSSCPNYSDFQNDVQGVGNGETGSFTFNAGLNCTYGPSNGVTSTLTVQAGATIIITGNGALTIAGGTAQAPGDFELITLNGNGASLTLNGTTLEYGRNSIVLAWTGTSVSVSGSGFLGNKYSGIAADQSSVNGVLNVSGSTFSGNTNAAISLEYATNPTVTVTNSIISDNGDGIDAGNVQGSPSKISVSGVNFAGNGIGIFAGTTYATPSDNSPDITVFGCTFTTSGGGDNAGIWIANTVDGASNSPKIAVNTSSFTTGGGGNAGILFFGLGQTTAGSPRVTVNNSTIRGGGGGDAAILFYYVAGGDPSVAISNSTLLGSGGGDGGIVMYQTSAGNPSVTVSNSTIRGDDSYDMGIVVDQTSGSGNPSISTAATILANNGGGDCVLDSSSRLHDDGYNLADDSTCNFSQATSKNGDTGLNLLPPVNHGGPTATVALGPGSSAIDQIPAGTQATVGGNPVTICPSTTGLLTDQRGIDRLEGPKCDVGAYEAPAVTVSTTPGSPASSGWYNAGQLGANGTLSVNASFSGLSTGEVADCSGAAFTGLPSAAVTTMNATASGTATLGDGTYTIGCDVSQGNSTLGVSYQGPTQIQIDTIAPTLSPDTSGQYLRNASAPLTCSDGGSGVATCQVTVKLPDGSTAQVSGGSNLPTSQTGSYTVTPTSITDVAGNAAAIAPFGYTVTYQLTTLPGSTTIVNRGYYALLRFYPADANGHDEASRTLPVSSVELRPESGAPIPFAYPFQFGTFNGKAGYQLSINTRNLTPGNWALVVKIGTGPTATTGTIAFTVR